MQPEGNSLDKLSSSERAQPKTSTSDSNEQQTRLMRLDV